MNIQKMSIYKFFFVISQTDGKLLFTVEIIKKPLNGGLNLFLYIKITFTYPIIPENVTADETDDT